MEHSERRRADALDNYWDAVQSGDPQISAKVDGLTAAIIAAVDRSSTADQLQDVQQRVKQGVSAMARTMDAQMQASLAIPAGSTTVPKKPAVRSTWVYGIAAAAVLLITMIAGYALLGGNDSEKPDFVPAAAVPTASPVPTITAITLFETTIAKEAIPDVDSVSAGIKVDEIPVGTTTAWTPYCCSGVMIDFAKAGNYAMQAVAPIKVIRADGQVEEIPSNTEVAIGPGDAVISRIETAFTLTNTGTVPVQLFNWVFIDDEGQFGGRGIPGTNAVGIADVQGVESQSGLAIVRMQRVTMPPGSTLVPPEGDYNFVIRLAYSDAGTPQTGIGYLRIDDGPVENNGKVDVEIYVLTLDQASDATAVPSS